MLLFVISAGLTATTLYLAGPEMFTAINVLATVSLVIISLAQILSISRPRREHYTGSYQRKSTDSDGSYSNTPKHGKVVIVPA